MAWRSNSLEHPGRSRTGGHHDQDRPALHKIGLLNEPERNRKGYKQYGVGHLLRVRGELSRVAT